MSPQFDYVSTQVIRSGHIESAPDWLCQAFGFVIDHVEHDDSGQLDYVTLRMGRATVLVCRADGSVFDDLMAQPLETNYRVTQTCYLTVPDVAAHFENARQYGAKIEVILSEDDSGRTFYICRDPDDHVWCFGDRPFNVQAASPDIAGTRSPAGNPSGQHGRNSVGKSAALMVIAAAISVGVFLALSPDTMGVSTNKTASGQGFASFDHNRPTETENTNRLPVDETVNRARVLRRDAEAETAAVRQRLKSVTKELDAARRRKNAAVFALSALKVRAAKEKAAQALQLSSLQAGQSGVQASLRLRLIHKDQRLAFANAALVRATHRLKTSKQQAAGLVARLATAEQHARQATAHLSNAEDQNIKLRETLAEREAELRQVQIDAKRHLNDMNEQSARTERAEQKTLAADVRLRALAATMTNSKELIRNEPLAFKERERKLADRLAFTTQKLDLSVLQLEKERERADRAERDLSKTKRILAAASRQTESLDQEVGVLRTRLQAERARTRPRQKTRATTSKRKSRPVSLHTPQATNNDQSTEPGTSAKPTATYQENSPIPSDPKARREVLGALYDCDASVQCD